MVSSRTILVVGSGGREHALAWKLAQSPQVGQIWVAPGNGGTAGDGVIRNVAIAAEDGPALLAFAQSHGVDLTVVGPEAPLAAGVVDLFQACLLYTSDAADERSSVDLGGRRIIKKQK